MEPQIHSTPAAKLASQSTGKPRRISDEERQRRRESAANARAARAKQRVQTVQGIKLTTEPPKQVQVSVGRKRKIVLPRRRSGGFTMIR